MVLQRIQTLFILLAATLVVVFLFVPFGYADVVSAQEGTQYVALKANMERGLMIPLAVAFVLMIIAFISFKKLAAQKLLVVLAALCVCAAIIALIYLLVSGMVDITPGYEIAHVYWGGGGLLLVAAVISLVMAYRGIRHDEKLLRSYESFR